MLEEKTPTAAPPSILVLLTFYLLTTLPTPKFFQNTYCRLVGHQVSAPDLAARLPDLSALARLSSLFAYKVRPTPPDPHAVTTHSQSAVTRAARSALRSQHD